MQPEQLHAHVLLALGVIIAAASCAGWLLSRIGQPRVIGEILAGILLGPSLLGAVWPDALDYLFPPEVVSALRVLAQIGLVLFMFLVGLELDLTRVGALGRKAVVISQASIVLPVALGALLAAWLYPRFGEGVDRLGFALFLGAAMAITAFPVLARLLHETGLMHTRVGVLAITCAAVDDVTAWCLLAVVVATVQATSVAEVSETVLLSMVFLVAMWWVVRPILARWRAVTVAIAICVVFVAAWTTEQIGIHAIFGAFMAGAVMPRRPEVQVVVHERLEHVTVVFLLPVFFVVIGLSTRIDSLDSAYLWATCALIVATAIAGKWGGAMLAARAMGETWGDATALGILMNTRGLTELVILNVGLELEVISPTLFTMMVIMALVTTFMAIPMLAVFSPAYLGGTMATRARTRRNP